MAKTKQVEVPGEMFEEYKRCVLGLLDRLGIKDWIVRFEHADLGEDAAQVGFDCSDRTAVFSLANRVSPDQLGRINPRGSASHEVAHLLMGTFSQLAEARSVTLAELRREEERIAVTLELAFEGLLPRKRGAL